MSYDSPEDGSPPNWAPRPKKDPQDLEVLVTALEVAAVILSPAVDSSFTKEELIEKAKEITGPETPLQTRDLEIVLANSGFLKKKAGRLSLR